MKEKNKYEYLLEYTEEYAEDLTFAVYGVAELIEQNQIDEKGKIQFFSVMKKIIQRGDYTSYCCINLLRDIMTSELYDFLLEELKKEIFKDEAISIEIMKIITVDGFPEYYDFLESVKDDSNISVNFRKFINLVLDLNNGKTGVLIFPVTRWSKPNITSMKEIEIDWSDIV